MEDTLLHKLLKWIVASSVGLLALPISVFIIIFSLYPDLGTDKNFNLFKLKSYYDICYRVDSKYVKENAFLINSNIEKEVFNFKNSLFPSPCLQCEQNVFQSAIKKNAENKKKHILLIDHTLSTYLDSSNFINVRKQLITNLSNQQQTKINIKDVRKLFFLTLESSYNLSDNDTLLVFSYRCQNFVDPPKIITKGTQSEILSIGDIEKCETGIQRTNFHTIFNVILNFIEKHPREYNSITFFSDFYHDDPIIEIDHLKKDIEKFQKITDGVKLNLIVLWQEDYKDKQRKDKQKKLLEYISLYYDGISKIDYIYTDDYNDDRYWIKEHKFEEFEEILTPNESMNKDTTIIALYAATTNSLKYNEAICKIKMNNNNPFKWKIKSLDPTKRDIEFLKYNRNCQGQFYEKNHRYFINQWYEEECDSLYLCVKLKQKKDNYIDDLRFVYCYKDKKGKNYFGENKIVIKEIFFETKHRDNLRYILNTFCVFLVVIIISGELLVIIDLKTLIDLCYEYKNRLTKRRTD